ncbi:winged helix-turn-helix domain-containing protein [Streptomyces yangpuensis]|uniref:Winged helix-turn-helix domain-containing protein n=1 Tax=Streptomyces yangpuensis TaxID=1648182 RepID=A0ABY5PXN7_9ACTN|nr:BTAD domain-containing putative transcriptional regulator [Streptomyces yangpuensis]UUY48869.1 winged helix-turn-helix domain-containing protein [Streptomyces yangpuensis]
MRISMLGALDVRGEDGSGVGVGGTRLRALLILLALEPGRVVASELLIDGIWAQDPPACAANALQALVSRLRRALPAGAVASHPAGYRLAVEPDAVDVVRFERLASEGRAALARDPGAAARLLREALELWRGPALLDVAGSDFFRPPVARLSELRMAVLEDRIEADLRGGRGRELTAELTSLVAEHPLRERLVGALMRALVAAGRPAEALTAYAAAREALAEELGADPSPELSALHTAVLRGEVPAGAAPAPPAPPPQQPQPQPSAPVTTPVPAPAPTPLTNLRAGLASFVGRDDDLAHIAALVSEFRLTTLTGPGGAGKTRLAVQSARPLLDRFPDGVWLVELAPLSTDADLVPAVLNALALREHGPAAGDPLDRLTAALRTRTALLVLDNCEHLIEAAAATAGRLLGECPGLRVLATSREPLGLTGEALWPVPPLALPPREADGDADRALSYAAVRLLHDRAVAARPGFAVTDRTAAAVTRICRALDGMPLAIELAAARLRTMSAEQLAARLDDRFRLLTSGARSAPRQHRTLRAVVDWSWELLSEPERALLRRLAAFPGGATVEAAEGVCAGGPVEEDDVLGLLASLADKSLLVTDGDGRHRMLETIRAYGLDRLAEAGEEERIRRAHAAYFTGLARTADPYLRRAEQLDWLARLTAEHDNLSAALRGAIAAGDARAAVRLVAAAGWYWWLSGRKAEGAQLALQALALPDRAEASDPAAGDRAEASDPAAGCRDGTDGRGGTDGSDGRDGSDGTDGTDGRDEESRAVACALAVLFATAGLGDDRQNAELLREGVLLAGRTGSRHPVVRFLDPLDRILRGAAAGEGPPADAWEGARSDEDPWVRAQALLEGAKTLLGTGGRPERAEAAIEAALAGFRGLGERWGISFALTLLADLVARRGDLAAAIGHYEEAVAVLGELGAVEDRLYAWVRQAQLRLLAGDPAGGAAAMARAERAAVAAGWPEALAMVAHGKADLARWNGEPEVARAELVRAREAVREVAVHPVFRAVLLDSLGYLDAAAGGPAAARAHRAEALGLALDAGHAPTLAQVLVGVADQALRLDRPQEAARLLAAALAVRGGPDHSRADAARVEDAARAALAGEYPAYGEPPGSAAATEAAEAATELAREVLGA